MGYQNPWKVENIEAFSFYCCPECDFKSKVRDYFKRHAMESHNKSKIFFTISKSENTINKYTSKYKNEEDIENFIASAIRGEFEGKEIIKESELKAKKPIINPDLEIFDENETAHNFEVNLKTEYNAKELETYDEANYENITDSETSDNETFDGMESYDSHVEKTLTFNGENSENVEILVKKYFPDTDEVEDLDEIENQKIQENLLSEKFGEAKLEKPKKEKKPISRKTQKILPLDIHIALVNEGKKALKCHICDYNCNKKSIMNRHIKSVHEGKKPFKCGTCDKRFYRKCDMNRHITSVHEGKKEFKCGICDKIFSQKSNLNTHMASVHEGKKAFNCGICDKIFSQKGNLNTHMASVHEGKKPFKCGICDTSFAEKGTLNRHMASVHEGKKPFTCNVCDASFTSIQSMKSHINSVHEGKKPFKCNICDASYVRKQVLNRHVESVHGGKKRVS